MGYIVLFRYLSKGFVKRKVFMPQPLLPICFWNLNIDFIYGDLSEIRFRRQGAGKSISAGWGLGEIVLQAPDEGADLVGAGGEAVQFG